LALYLQNLAEVFKRILGTFSYRCEGEFLSPVFGAIFVPLFAARNWQRFLLLLMSGLGMFN
jgi:hypothetical protein